MPIKLGSVNKKIPYSKAYLGNKLVYQSVKLIPFSSCPFPTSWTQVTSRVAYKYTNQYGEWNISANTSHYNLYDLKNAFDNNYNTAWVIKVASGYVTINCPVAICPTAGTVKYENLGYYKNFTVPVPSYVQGYNAETGVWENLVDLPPWSATKNFTISTTNYYTSFRIAVTKQSDTEGLIYEFQITSGTIKIE